MIETITLTLPGNPDAGCLHSSWTLKVEHLSENREVYISIHQSGTDIYNTNAACVAAAQRHHRVKTKRNSV